MYGTPVLRTQRHGQAGHAGRSLLILIGCLGATVYFAHHALNGTHGHHAQARLLARSVSLERETARLAAVREGLARDVAALSSEPPAPDITEEIARDLLGFGRAGEFIKPGR